MYFSCSHGTGGSGSIWIDMVTSSGLQKSWKYDPTPWQQCVAISGDKPTRFIFLDGNEVHMTISVDMTTGAAAYASPWKYIAGTVNLFDDSNIMMQGVFGKADAAFNTPN